MLYSTKIKDKKICSLTEQTWTVTWKRGNTIFCTLQYIEIRRVLCIFKIVKYCYRICGKFVRFAGGMTVPEFRTKGTGAPSHWAAKTCSCIAKSRCSAGKRWSHIVCRRNVMCRVARAEWPIRLAATTNSCNSWICKAGQPCIPSVTLLPVSSTSIVTRLWLDSPGIDSWLRWLSSSPKCPDWLENPPRILFKW
jgi:hypothetical protein